MKKDYATHLLETTEAYQNLPPEARQSLKRKSYRHRFALTFVNTIWLIPFIATLIVLAAVLLLPIYRTYGSAMSPTIYDGNMVALTRTKNIDNGEIASFYYNNKVLIRRVIAQGGQVVDIDKNGTITIDGEILKEDYLDPNQIRNTGNTGSTGTTGTTTTITYPFTVPEDQLFVLGDDRALAIDSRAQHFGTVTKEQLIGKVWIKFWPVNEFQWF